MTKGENCHLTNVAAVTAASLFSVTLFSPLDRLKLILQTQPMSRSTLRYSGFLGYGAMWKNEGFTGYWRGNMAAVWRTMGNGVFRFGLFEVVRRGLFGEDFVADAESGEPNLKGYRGKSHGNYLHNLISGWIAGGISIAALYPLDLARTRIAADIN